MDLPFDHDPALDGAEADVHLPLDEPVPFDPPADAPDVDVWEQLQDAEADEGDERR